MSRQQVKRICLFILVFVLFMNLTAIKINGESKSDFIYVEQSLVAPPVDSNKNENTLLISINKPLSLLKGIKKPQKTEDFKSSQKPIKEQEKEGLKIEENKKEINYSVPNINSSFKAYMDYRCITDRTSKQWEIQKTAITDNETGIRMCGEYYLVALGSYYTQNCGEKFIIRLSSGKEFKVMIGDLKADAHTNSTHQYSQNGNIIEFIVDTYKISKLSKQMGDISCSGFEGTITSIIKILD